MVSSERSVKVSRKTVTLVSVPKGAVSPRDVPTGKADVPTGKEAVRKDDQMFREAMFLIVADTRIRTTRRAITISDLGQALSSIREPVGRSENANYSESAVFEK